MANPYFGTPQTRPIAGREAVMERNDAGGFGFRLDDWQRLDRFLTIGSVGGTYYVGQRGLTTECREVVVRCLSADGIRTVEAAHAVNVSGRAPGTDEQLYVIMLAMRHGDPDTKVRVAELLPGMLRTGTHTLHFGNMLFSLDAGRRSSRAKRWLVAEWFELQDPDDLAFQVVKYQQRDGVAMRDLLRYSHPKAPTPAHAAVYDWICGRGVAAEPLPKILRDHLHMADAVAAGMPPAEAALEAVKHTRLPREALPPEGLADLRVLTELLGRMPPHALLRNLGSMSSRGLFGPDNPGAEVARALVCSRLADRNRLARARVHPFAVLLALLVYSHGQGVRGGRSWAPDAGIRDCLESAFQEAFVSAEPTGQRILVAVDVSGSMSAECRGTPLKAETAAAALAIVLARTEPDATVCVFDTQVRAVVPVNRNTRVDSLHRFCGGGTDLAAPLTWLNLSSHPGPVDAVVILTDNETWAGSLHSTEALAHYRRKVKLPVKLAVCAMTATRASVTDPDDPLQLGCAGLDASLPLVIRNFLSPETRRMADGA